MHSNPSQLCMCFTGTFEPHDMRQMQLQMAELRVQLNNTSQTTQTAQDLGAVSKYNTQSLALQMNGCSAAHVVFCAVSFLLPVALLYSRYVFQKTSADYLAGSRCG